MEFIKNKSTISSSILFISINIIIFIYIINPFSKTNIQNIRNLEEDPRTKGVNEICMQIDGNDLYDLKELEAKKYNLTQNIFLQFCKNIDNYASSCIYQIENKVIKLSGDIKGEDGNNNKVEIKSNGLLNVFLSAGEKNSQNKNYKVNIELQCDEKINEFTLTNDNDISSFDPINSEETTLTIKGKCKQACVIKDKYGTDLGIAGNVITGIILLGFGVYIGFFGYRGRLIGIFLVCIAGFVLLANIILNLFNENNLTISIIVQAVFGLCGFGLSMFFIYKQKYLKFYMILVGGITGYVIGNTLNNLFISIIDTEHIKLISILVIVVFIIVGVIFGIFLTKGTFIVGTSIIGSYCLMRAFSFFLYNVAPFVNELKIYDLATHGNYDKIVEMIWGLFLIYPAMLIVFIVATIIVQIKLNPKWRDVDDYKLLEKNFETAIDLPNFKMTDEDDDNENKEELK